MRNVEKLILGTVQFGLNYGINNSYGKIPTNHVIDILDYAQSVGIEVLDTAAGYGDSEEKIGNFHGNANRVFQIITKFDKVSGIGWEESIRTSLERLKVTIAETVMFHSFESYNQAKQYLPSMIAKGKDKYFNRLGVSVYTDQELEELIYEKNINVVQLPFNLLDNESLRGTVMQQLKKNGKTIHVRSVFLQGLFYKSLQQLPTKLYPLKPYLVELQKIANDEGIDIGTLAIQYVLSKAYIDGIIIGVDSKSQLEKNIEAINQQVNPKVFERIDDIKVNDTTLLNPSTW